MISFALQMITLKIEPCMSIVGSFTLTKIIKYDVDFLSTMLNFKIKLAL